MPSVTCVHCDEDSPLLPDVIRGGHYLHNRHVCAVLSCDHAPYGEVNKLLANAQYCINPFPVLVKGRISEIQTILASAPIYQNRTYRTISVKIADLYGSSETDLLYSNGLGAGYPMNKVILALAYLIAAVTNQLNGLRPKGSKDTIISEYLKSHPDAEVLIMRPDLFTPIVIQMGVYGALVGPNNPKVYKKLIQKCPDNPYKIKVRAITEADLK